ncbi:hypothetical protein HK098_002061 [Nowakowskiella sp. JEL0407]|nr:hypothetical protein HK098_002061 [Nowakowskiella sp. JEL0407]
MKFTKIITVKSNLFCKQLLFVDILRITRHSQNNLRVGTSFCRKLSSISYTNNNTKPPKTYERVPKVINEASNTLLQVYRSITRLRLGRIQYDRFLDLAPDFTGIKPYDIVSILDTIASGYDRKLQTNEQKLAAMKNVFNIALEKGVELTPMIYVHMVSVAAKCGDEGYINFLKKHVLDSGIEFKPRWLFRVEMDRAIHSRNFIVAESTLKQFTRNFQKTELGYVGIIKAYSEIDEIEKMLEVFQEVLKLADNDELRVTCTIYQTFFAYYERHQQWEKILELYQDMEMRNISPSTICVTWYVQSLMKLNMIPEAVKTYERLYEPLTKSSIIQAFTIGLELATVHTYPPSYIVGLLTQVSETKAKPNDPFYLAVDKAMKRSFNEYSLEELVVAVEQYWKERKPSLQIHNVFRNLLRSCSQTGDIQGVFLILRKLREREFLLRPGLMGKVFLTPFNTPELIEHYSKPLTAYPSDELIKLAKYSVFYFKNIVPRLKTTPLFVDSRAPEIAVVTKELIEKLMLGGFFELTKKILEDCGKRNVWMFKGFDESLRRLDIPERFDGEVELIIKVARNLPQLGCTKEIKEKDELAYLE